MADLEQLKQKYASVLDLFPKFEAYGAKLEGGIRTRTASCTLRAQCRAR